MGTMCFEATIDKVIKENDGLERIAETAHVGFYATPETAFDAVIGFLSGRYEPLLAKKLVKDMNKNKPDLLNYGCIGKANITTKYTRYSNGLEYKETMKETYRVWIIPHVVQYEPIWPDAYFQS